MLNMPINDQVANVVISQLLYLDREDPDKDISLYIHSPGGVVTAGLAIYDTMQLIRPGGLHHLSGYGCQHGYHSSDGRQPRANAMLYPMPPFTCTRCWAALRVRRRIS